jgi:hypothetical protein
MENVLQRADWYGDPLKQGDLFRLNKTKGGAQLEALCELWSHPLGWEVWLTIAGDLHRSEVCRSQDDVLTTCEQWKAAMTDKGRS